MLMSTGMIIKSVEDNKEIGKVVIYGDINGNGQIEIADRNIFSAIFIRNFQPTDSQKIAADVNHDGIVDENDRDLLAGILNGNIKQEINQNVEAKIPTIIYTEQESTTNEVTENTTTENIVTTE